MPRCGQIPESVRIKNKGAADDPGQEGVTADDNLFERIPWPDIYKRLRAMAGWLTRDRSRVFDAVSADDLVSETLLDFLSSPSGLGWTPSRGKLETFLRCTQKQIYRSCTKASA